VQIASLRRPALANAATPSPPPVAAAPAEPPSAESVSPPASVPAAPSPPEEPAPAPTASPAEAPELLKLVQGRWEQIIARVAERSRGGAEVLRDARPVRQEGENTIVLQFQSEFPYAQMQSEKRRQFVEQTISRLLGGRPVTLRSELVRPAPAPSNAEVPGDPEEEEDPDGVEYAREVAQTFNGYIEPEGG